MRSRASTRRWIAQCQSCEGQRIPYAQGERLAELIAQQPCIRVENSGHLMQEDRPEAIVAAVFKQIGAA